MAAADVSKEDLPYDESISSNGSNEFVSGFEFEIDGHKLDDYFCFICHMLLRNSAELPCHHLMCKGCLDKWNQ